MSLTGSFRADDEYDFDVERACVGTYGRCCPVRLFPPPMPMLARTEQLRSYMPWTLLKFRCNDGRVVMKEVRTKQHEYFKAGRQNGNRTLQLMSADENSPAFFTGFNRAVLLHAKAKSEARSSKKLKSRMPSYFATSSGKSLSSYSTMSSPSSSDEEEIDNENFETEPVDIPQDPGEANMEDDEMNATASLSTSESPSNASSPSPSPSPSEPAFPELCSIYDAYNGAPFSI